MFFLYSFFMFEGLRLSLGIRVTEEETRLYNRLKNGMALVRENPVDSTRFSYVVYKELVRSELYDYSGRFKEYFGSLFEEL